MNLHLQVEPLEFFMIFLNFLIIPKLYLELCLAISNNEFELRLLIT